MHSMQAGETITRTQLLCDNIAKKKLEKSKNAVNIKHKKMDLFSLVNF